MADITKLIDDIRNAEHEQSISPEMVADVLAAINRAIPDLTPFRQALSYAWVSRGTPDNPQLRLNLRTVDGTETSAGIPMASAADTLAGIISYQDYLRFNAAARLFQELWNKTCGPHGRYNPDTAFYELNGLTDITYEEALLIYACGITTYPYPSVGHPTCSSLRTNILASGQLYADSVVNAPSIFRGWSRAETLRVAVDGHPVKLNAPTALFGGCTNLRSILGEIDFHTAPSPNIFGSATALEEVRITNLRHSIRLPDSPRLSIDTLNHLVTKSAATAAAPVTVTVHPTVYAKLTGTYDWSAGSTGAVIATPRLQWEILPSLAADKNITFISA